MKVLVEIEFYGDVDTRFIPDIISNRDAVLILGENIKDIRVVTKQRGEEDAS